MNTYQNQKVKGVTMQIRSVALAILRRNRDEILVQKITFPGHSTIYYRPIGGTVELGENSKTTLIRELKEELNQEIEEPSLVAVIENIFGLEEIGHEIDFIYEAEFKDKRVYHRGEIEGIEGNEQYKAIWKSIHEFIEPEEDIKLVPDGLIEFLADQGSLNQQLITHIKTR